MTHLWELTVSLALCTLGGQVCPQPKEGVTTYLTKGGSGCSYGLRVCLREGSLEGTRQ